MKRERWEPVDYFEAVVLPSLFERLDAAFPEFGWKWKSPGWVATNRSHTKSLPGEPRPDRVVCNLPRGFFVHGGGFTHWTAYVHRGARPTGRDFFEVARELAERAGVDPSPLERDRTPEEEERFHKRERRQGLLESFHAFTKHALQDAQAARDYLEDRGFGKDLEALPFGFCPSFSEVREYLEGQGFTPEELDASGLLKDSRWEGRLVLPWRDRWGHTGTFVARDLTGEAEAGQKYLYLSGATKPDLYGLDVALRAGREDLVLVEGLLDVVSLQEKGFPTVAALGGNGSLLTAARWERLAELGVRAVTLALDSDEPGRSGLEAALDNLTKGDNVPVVYVVDPARLGEHKDPDALVRKEGLEAFRSVLAEAQSGPLYRVRTLLGDVSPSSPEKQRRAAVEHASAFLDGLRGSQRELDREDGLRLVAQATGYTFETLAELAEDRTERHKREEAERSLGGLLRDAQAARERGENARAVARSLSEGLASLQTKAEEQPPLFSVERLERESAELPEGLRSRWNALDALEVRFNPGELALLAARTGHGKTTALVCLLRNWIESEEDKLFVLYSAEEPEVRVFHRLLALLSAKGGASWTKNEVRDYLRSPLSRGEEYGWPAGNLEKEKKTLRSWEDRLLVVHKPFWTVADIANHARSLKQEVGAVLVDYLQRVPAPEGRYDRRDIEVSAVGRRLKGLSVELSCPVVAAAQINREAVPTDYKRKLEGKGYEDALEVIRTARPELHRLREGGSEQEADLVLGLLNYRADFEEDRSGGKAPDVTPFEVGALKNRYGTPGSWAKLAFEGRHSLLRDPRPEERL